MFLTDEASVRIRMVDTNGIISTLAGTGRPGGYSGDGGPADQAEISLPWGQSALPVGRICVFGNTLYLADTYNHIVRAVDLSTTIITTVAGTPGVFGHDGDGGPATAAKLSGPADVDVDKDGNLFIADTYNHVIRKVDTGGVITTFAGKYQESSTGTAFGGYGGDGGSPTEAVLNQPYGIAFDADQRLYIADTHNNRIRIVY
jgi:sugar lactone lactonase YvrE